MMLGHAREHVHPLMRFVIGFIGASLSTGPLFANGLRTYDIEKPMIYGTQVVQTTYLAGLILIWVLTVLLTTYKKRSHEWDCIMDGFGLPGLFVAVSLSGQVAIQ